MKSNFQVLDEMSARNMNILLAPLSNIIESRIDGVGKGKIVIGVSPICFIVGLVMVAHGNNAGFLVMLFGLLLDD